MVAAVAIRIRGWWHAMRAGGIRHACAVRSPDCEMQATRMPPTTAPAQYCKHARSYADSANARFWKPYLTDCDMVVPAWRDGSYTPQLRAALFTQLSEMFQASVMCLLMLLFCCC